MSVRSTDTHRRAQLVFSLLGSLPLGAGKKVRAIAYRRLFEALGNDVEIAARVEFIVPSRIQLHPQSVIWQNCSLNCWTPDSRIELGRSAVLDRGVYLQALGGSITIGEKSYIGPYCCIAGPGDVRIGDNCLIASHTSIYGNNHVFDNPDLPINQQSLDCRGVSLGNDVWLGSGVRVMDGVQIGDGAVIGANAVVTRDIPPYSIAVGVPARVIKSRRPESN